MEPTTGTVEVGDQQVRGPMPHEIAFVFQENALFPWSTVIENVKLGMMFQGVPQGRAREARAAFARSGRARGFRRALSGPALRRHAPARGAGARAQPGDRHPADGRAVRRARRADPHGAGRGPLGAAVAHRQDHRVRDPQPGRGGVPRRPRRGVLGPPRHHQGDHRGRRAASAQARLHDLGEVHRHPQPALRRCCTTKSARRSRDQPACAAARAGSDDAERASERSGRAGRAAPFRRCS